VKKVLLFFMLKPFENYPPKHSLSGSRELGVPLPPPLWDPHNVISQYTGSITRKSDERIVVSLFLFQFLSQNEFENFVVI